MPAVDISEDFISEKLTLFRLAALKNKWLVSMQALARRARELQIINDRQYRYIMMQISQKGWRSEEPIFQSSQSERPRALRKLAEVAFGVELNYRRIASQFNLSLKFVGSVLDRCQGAPNLPTAVPRRTEQTPPSRIISFPRKK
jgi:hypothetical protein